MKRGICWTTPTRSARFGAGERLSTTKKFSSLRSKFDSVVRDDQVRPRPFDGREDLVHHARTINPSALRRRLHHRILAADVVRRHRQIEVVAGGADDVEV